MNYSESLRFLEFHWKFGMKLGLERITFLLAELGNPQGKFKSVQVAGTNGKGSVCALIYAGLQAAGHKAGLYTSPHLLSYTERIQIAGREITPEKFAEYLEMIKPAVEKCGLEVETPTEFEILTALAFKFFADTGVEVAVVETGLGGRLDATCVLLPEISVLTNISLDHTEVLGEHLDEIAEEKGGIIKPGIAVVAVSSGVEADSVIEQISLKNKSACVILKDAVLSSQIVYQKNNKKIPAGQFMDLKIKGKIYRDVFLPLIGSHQAQNAALAFWALKEISVPPEKILAGFSKASWRGRFEIISADPVVVLDGAHNPAGAKALADTFKEAFNSKGVFVLSILAQKDLRAILANLRPVSALIIAARSLHPQAVDPKVIAAEAEKLHLDCEIRENISGALKYAKQAARGKPICIAGSLYAIAEILSAPAEL